MPKYLRAYWQDCDDVVESADPRELSFKGAINRWADSRGVKGNFLGLIDDDDNTMQLYFEESIPDNVGDARYLKIVLVDFPIPKKKGSFQKRITIAESEDFIKLGYKLGLLSKNFGELEFCSW